MKKFITYAIDLNVFLASTSIFDAQEWEHLEYAIDFSFQSDDKDEARAKGREYIINKFGVFIGSVSYIDSCPYILLDIIVNEQQGLFKLIISESIEDFFNDKFKEVMIADMMPEIVY